MISRPGSMLAGLLAITSPLLADDLTNFESFLCSAVQATECRADGECFIGSPWNWEFPQFVEVDLEARQVATTQASGEDRSTPILSQSRADGQIVLQGVQLGRAFSFVVDEATGLASIAIAASGKTVTVFAACTPKSDR